MKRKNIFLYAVASSFIYLFSMYYMHMDCNLFWSHPYEYLSELDFPYMILASFELGLLNIGLPVAAVLNIRMISERTFKGIVQYWLGSLKQCFLALAFPFLFFVLSSFLVMPHTGQSGWQSVGSRGAYQWRVSNEFIWVYIVECFGRLFLSAAFWCTLGVSLRICFERLSKFQLCNIVFIFSVVLSVALSRKGLQSFDLSFLQNPFVDNRIPLKQLLLRQIAYVMASICFFFSCIGVKRAIKQRKSADKYEKYYAMYYGILVVGIPLLSVFIRGFDWKGNNLFLNVFGGINWGSPTVNINDCIGWIILFIPILSIIEHRRVFTKSQLKGAAYRECAAYAMLVSFFMFLIVYTVNLLNGGEITRTVTTNKMDLSQLHILAVVFALFALQAGVIGIVYTTLNHFLESDLSAIGTMLTVFVMLLLGSNEDKLVNEKLFTNWGMVLRSSCFSQEFVTEYYEDGTCKIFTICSIDIRYAFLYQALLAGAMIIFGLLFIKYKRKTGNMQIQADTVCK